MKEMKWKKMLAAMMVGAMSLTAVSAVPGALASTAYAAKGGAKFSAPKAAPAAPKASTPSAGSSSKAASPNNKDYAPSKSAKDLQKDAPASAAKPGAAAGTTAAAANTGSRFGSIMRGIGLFAGGMFLGSMLSNLFGMGAEGFLAEMMGLVMNIILILAVVMILRWAWNKFRGGSSQDSYRRGYEAAMRQQGGDIIDVTPRGGQVQDIAPRTSDGYDARTTADRYRSR